MRNRWARRRGEVEKGFNAPGKNSFRREMAHLALGFLHSVLYSVVYFLISVSCFPFSIFCFLFSILSGKGL